MRTPRRISGAVPSWPTARRRRPFDPRALSRCAPQGTLGPPRALGCPNALCRDDSVDAVGARRERPYSDGRPRLGGAGRAPHRGRLGHPLGHAHGAPRLGQRGEQLSQADLLMQPSRIALLTLAALQAVLATRTPRAQYCSSLVSSIRDVLDEPGVSQLLSRAFAHAAQCLVGGGSGGTSQVVTKNYAFGVGPNRAALACLVAKPLASSLGDCCCACRKPRSGALGVDGNADARRGVAGQLVERGSPAR